MKLLIASDIHGSAYYCGRLLDIFQQEKAERLLLLGDILYHGPRNDLPRDYAPKEVTAQLRALDAPILGVRGNCDAEIDQMVLGFPLLSDYALLLTEGHTIFATHGHIYSPEDHPPLRSGDIFLSGHIHIPVCKERNGILYLNPGSVSLPKEDTPHSCMSFDGQVFRWLDMDGRVYQEYRLEG
ncbi:MAG: phosphodiesterase [Oscillospiraceae bacterium]|nr:phosphodiesterase [Oscillospiraceae bacterium]